MYCSFVPPYLLRQLVTSGDRTLEQLGRSTLEVDQRFRARRGTDAPPLRPSAATGERRVIHDAENTENLPGRVARRDADPPTGDLAVDEAWVSSGTVGDMVEDVFDRRGMDGQGTTASVSVHYGRNYDNAFWDGRQLVFGDGDGVIFERFTKAADVMAHEFTHGVVHYSANLAYEGQPGALNESVCDVFAALTRQWAAEQPAAEADWLIGVGLFRPGVSARGLRSMLEPGTAYDDPRLGRDPQVGSMADYVETEDDNGGVHLNSGIPNRAFALAAVALGGYSWQRAGRCWYDALTGGEVRERTDFAGFAGATVSSARRLFADDATVADAIAGGWAEVGVGTDSAQDGAVAGGVEATAGHRAASRVAVRRTGGFAGLVRSGELDLDGSPAGEEVRQLLGQVDPAKLIPHPPVADRFVYVVEYGETHLRVFQEDLTPELRRVVQIVLGE